MTDYRLPQHRRETFMRFYEFHLRYKSHPGGVYMFIPHLAKTFGWNLEQRLWFGSINALTQHPMTSLAIFQKQPEPFRSGAEIKDFEIWFGNNWYQLPFDTDRRYQKKEAPTAMDVLSQAVREYGSLQALYTGDFTTLWKRVRTELWSLGRLGAWSGLEFIKIAAQGELDFMFDTLMLDDISGSKSHRNGLCIVLGHDNMDWRKDNPVTYSLEHINYLKREGQTLLLEAQTRFMDLPWIGDVGYETLESTLCCYKSWHRPNRRYPSVYNDMAYGRLLDTKAKNPGLDLTPFWEARKKHLPKHLRIEDNPSHPQHGKIALDRGLQNLYRETGKLLYLDEEVVC